jgi:hypothetical protein
MASPAGSWGHWYPREVQPVLQKNGQHNQSTSTQITLLHITLYVQVTVYCDNLCINNQQDASSSKILFCHKTLHVSGIYCAHHQELSAVDVAIGMFHAGLGESGCSVCLDDIFFKRLLLLYHLYSLPPLSLYYKFIVFLFCLTNIVDRFLSARWPSTRAKA